MTAPAPGKDDEKPRAWDAALRPAMQSDVDLLYSSWLHSYWDAHPAALKDVRKAVYFRGHQEMIDALLPRSNVAVLCDTDSPGDVFGWACWEVRAATICVLHYAYVKKPFRRIGMGGHLLQHLVQLPDAPHGLAYTHQTRAGLWLLRRYTGAVFNPYLTR